MRSITDSTGTTTFSSYDNRARARQKSSPRGTIKYTYDPVGNLMSKTDASGTVAYVYDNVNRLKDLVDHGTFSPIHFLDYDDNDRPGTIIYNPAMTITRTWDGAGRALGISAAIQSKPVFDIGYDYYPGSNLLCSMFDNATIAQYSYDVLAQLTQERRVTGAPKALSGCGQIFSGSANARNRDWTYDAHHNRATQDVTTYNYDAADQLTQAIGPGSSPTTIYGYDRDANWTSRSDGLQLDYDAGNRTVGITPPLSSGGAAKKLTLKYSGLDQTQRTSLQVGVAQPTTFDYDGLGVGPSSSAQSVDSPSLGPSGSISGLGSSGSLISVPLTSITRAPGGGLVSLHVGSNTYFYITAGGSVRAIAKLDASGIVSGIVNSYSYNAWGEILSQAESVPQPFKFAGAESDALTGLYKMGARYYDPAVGRFTQPDPLGGGYQYVLNNPVNLVDPSGYCGEEDESYWTDEGVAIIISHPPCTTFDNPPDNPPEPGRAHLAGLVDVGGGGGLLGTPYPREGWLGGPEVRDAAVIGAGLGYATGVMHAARAAKYVGTAAAASEGRGVAWLVGGGGFLGALVGILIWEGVAH